MRKGNTGLFVLIFLLFAVFVSVVTALSVSANEKPVTNAKAAVLYEPARNRFLYTKNENARLPMASTTKIMTALVAAERLSPEDVVSIPKEAVGTEGSSAYFKEGEELTVKELLYAVLLQSANDASVALAVHTAGSTEAFALLMNEKADSLGLSDTNFTNPHGLHNDEHYTTAHDLALIAAAALKNPLVKEIAATERMTITTSTDTRTFLNHNKLLHLYDSCIGVKTGFTKNAGRCLVGAAERDGVLLISVTLNDPCDWMDHEKLLDLGFDLCENRTIAKKGDFEYTLPVIDGECESITLSLSSDVRAVLLKTDGEVKAQVCLPRYLAAPINEGDTVGRVIFTYEGEIIAEAPICANSTVKLKQKKGFFKRITEFFKK